MSEAAKDKLIAELYQIIGAMTDPADCLLPVLDAIVAVQRGGDCPDLLPWHGDVRVTYYPPRKRIDA